MSQTCDMRGAACTATGRAITRRRLPVIWQLFFSMLAASAAVASAEGLKDVFLFDIRAEGLDRALLDFGAQAHVQLSVAMNSAIKQRKAPALRGKYTARQALMILLKGTNLTFASDGETIEIVRMTQNLGSGTSPIDPPANGSSRAESEVAESGETADPKQAAAGARKQKGSARSLPQVTVTGTSIQGVVPVGVTIQTVDRVDIERSGYTTLDELLQSLPDNFRGGAAGASPDALFSRGAESGYNISFGSGVNLRGLGNNATLVLVDGHRIPSSGQGYYTDISAIPLSAIDHIEIITDGASAIYGTDAIAGVVNVILKKKSDGLFTDGRYSIGNGFTQYDGTSQYGQEWGSGGYTVDLDYLGQGALDVRDRAFTSSISSPTSLLPMSHTLSLSGAGQELIANSVMLFGDFEYSNRHSLENQGLYGVQTLIDVPSWSGSLTGRWYSPSSWMVNAEFSGGEGIENTTTKSFVAAGTPTLLDGLRDVSRYSEFELRATGSVGSLPAGAAKLAAGTSYLISDYSVLNTDNTGAFISLYGARRDVASAYGELFVPIVGKPNAVNGIESLTVSAAGRRDRYSDFGGTTNYKVGVSWYPLVSLQIRGAYSTSFRAPAVGTELVDSESGTTGLLLDGIYNQSRTALIPVLFEEGAVPNLGPETAKNSTFGVDYLPVAVPGLRLSLDYYHILYAGQIAGAPFEPFGLSDPALASAITQYSTSAPIEALVASAISKGILFYDATGGEFGPTPLSETVYLYDIRLANLSRTDTSGFDLSADYPISLGESTVNSAVSATYIRHFFTQLTSSAPILDLMNTVGYPARFRMSAQVAWTRRQLSLAVTGNYVGGYPDTSSAIYRAVASYTTINLVARYALSDADSLFHDASVSIAATNVFNRSPPYVAIGSVTVPESHYDAANADPLGRLISFEVEKHW